QPQRCHQKRDLLQRVLSDSSTELAGCRKTPEGGVKDGFLVSRFSFSTKFLFLLKQFSLWKYERETRNVERETVFCGTLARRSRGSPSHYFCCRSRPAHN